jgi:alpha-D-ribose 1-methylphosphonate 5-triphosphate synthase subunit PhnH
VQTVLPAFADPVADSQRAFRTLLDAMARPGRIVTFAGPATAPQGLGLAAAAVALTLVDMDTSVWLSPACADAAAWLRFHCGARFAAAPGESRFAFATSNDCPDLGSLDPGTNEYPDRSTTLVLEVAALGAGAGIELRGPGIESVATAAVEGVPPGLWAQREALHELFPRGIDIVFASGARALALPRTTRVEI